MTKTGKFRVISVMVLLVLAIPATGRANVGGPKKWFHLKGSGSASTHYRGNHVVVKHHAAQHPKPDHAKNPHR